MTTAGRDRWNQLTKEASAMRRAAGLHHDEAGNRLPPQEIARRRRAVPADTRDLTARFFGDPLPGRSALDTRGRA